MLLDALLARLDTQIEFFSVCRVSSGWRLQLPGPPTAMLHFVLEGEGTVRQSGKNERPVGPGTLVAVPKGSTHSLASPSDSESEQRFDVSSENTNPEATLFVAGDADTAALTVACGLVRVRYGAGLGLFDQLQDALIEDLSGVPRAQDVFEDLLVEQTDPGPGSPAMQRALMSQCLVLLLRRLCQRGECGLPWIAALQDPRLARVMEQILSDPAKPHTVELLADTATMSRSAFSERFARAFGVPPMGMVHRVRLERARLLLERNSSLSMDAVARRVGYSSRSHFSRSFKRQHGVSPAALRAALAN